MCPSLNDPANGNVNVSGDSFGQTAEYTCNNGFNLIGDSILTCGPDGQWSGNPPVCEGKHLTWLNSIQLSSVLPHINRAVRHLYNFV